MLALAARAHPFRTPGLRGLLKPNWTSHEGHTCLILEPCKVFTNSGREGAPSSMIRSLGHKIMISKRPALQSPSWLFQRPAISGPPTNPGSKGKHPPKTRHCKGMGPGNPCRRRSTCLEHQPRQALAAGAVGVAGSLHQRGTHGLHIILPQLAELRPRQRRHLGRHTGPCQNNVTRFRRLDAAQPILTHG